MAQTVADVLLDRLRQWDVPQVFGYPGDGINDHAGLEPELVAGAPQVVDGMLAVPDSPGHGMTVRPEAQRWRTDRAGAP